MKSSHCFLFVLIAIASLPAKSQVIDGRNVVSSIQTDVINFLIKVGELEKGKSIEYNINQITIVEIVSKNLLGYQKSGIFLFRVVKSPTTTYLLLKNDSKYSILDLQNTARTLQKVIKFLLKQGSSNDELIKYIEQINIIYNYNCYSCKYRM
jgi:hypothetical protein